MNIYPHLETVHTLVILYTLDVVFRFIHIDANFARELVEKMSSAPEKNFSRVFEYSGDRVTPSRIRGILTVQEKTTEAEQRL